MLAGPAMAQGSSLGKNIQTMTYEVYAGGINAVQAELDVAYENDKRYAMKLSARTKGFLAKLAPWKGSFETLGWLKKDGVDRPEEHKSVSVWKEEEEVKTYQYAPDGSFKDYKVIEDGRDYTPKELDEALTKGTTDAMTATLEVMKKVADGGKCEGSSEVFDGRRRYELVFSHESDDTLDSSRYNIYGGTAARCQVEVKPLAGAWHKKPRGWMSIQEQGREKGSLPTVWLAKISEDGPAVPVKIRVKTEYGTLFMHLVGYQNGDGVKLAAK
ncbi:MAG: DUF3108 domain-containing protein [Rhodospirillales bacterium]|nr:DUF3108 domain-containing protein [Rhodospirillales bacterium]